MSTTFSCSHISSSGSFSPGLAWPVSMVAQCRTPVISRPGCRPAADRLIGRHYTEAGCKEPSGQYNPDCRGTTLERDECCCGWESCRSCTGKKCSSRSIASQKSNAVRPGHRPKVGRGRPENKGFRFAPPDITLLNTNKRCLRDDPANNRIQERVTRVALDCLAPSGEENSRLRPDRLNLSKGSHRLKVSLDGYGVQFWAFELAR